jgi:hypothetical protein
MVNVNKVHTLAYQFLQFYCITSSCLRRSHKWKFIFLFGFPSMILFSSETFYEMNNHWHIVRNDQIPALWKYLRFRKYPQFRIIFFSRVKHLCIQVLIALISKSVDHFVVQLKTFSVAVYDCLSWKMTQSRRTYLWIISDSGSTFSCRRYGSPYKTLITTLGASAKIRKLTYLEYMSKTITLAWSLVSIIGVFLAVIPCSLVG